METRKQLGVNKRRGLFFVPAVSIAVGLSAVLVLTGIIKFKSTENQSYGKVELPAPPMSALTPPADPGNDSMLVEREVSFEAPSPIKVPKSGSIVNRIYDAINGFIQKGAPEKKETVAVKKTEAGLKEFASLKGQKSSMYTEAAVKKIIDVIPTREGDEASREEQDAIKPARGRRAKSKDISTKTPSPRDSLAFVKPTNSPAEEVAGGIPDLGPQEGEARGDGIGKSVEPDPAVTQGTEVGGIGGSGIPAVGESSEADVDGVKTTVGGYLSQHHHKSKSGTGCLSAWGAANCRGWGDDTSKITCPPGTSMQAIQTVPSITRVNKAGKTVQLYQTAFACVMASK